MRSRLLALASLAALALLGACTDPGSSAATLSLNLTDAPVASSAISHVYVSFGGLAVNESTSANAPESSWITVPLDPATRYDLLSLSDGVSALLGNVSLTGGVQINQIRFTDPLVKVVETADPTTELDCSLNSNSLKIVNAFALPLTGTLSLTVDFDVRKSLVYATGYKMTPVLRAVVDNEAGKIEGSYSSAVSAPAAGDCIIFAYKTGTYADSETVADPTTGATFQNAITSAAPRSDGAGGYLYTLAFLEAGSYDLVVYDSAAAAVADKTSYTGVLVESAKKTTEDISF